MGDIASRFASAFRDYVTDGLPASGPNDPSKPEIRAIGPAIELVLSGIGNGLTPFATVAAMNASALADGAFAFVYANSGTADDPANTVYQRTGGAFVASPSYFNALAAVVKPLVTLASHYANDATDTDVPGGQPGDRGAKFWAAKAAVAQGQVQPLLTTIDATSAAPGDRFLDAYGEIVAVVDGGGVTVADTVTAGRVAADSVEPGGLVITGVGDKLRFTDGRGEILAQLDATGKLTAAEFAGIVPGGGGATPAPRRVRRRIASTHGGSWTPYANGFTSNGGSQTSGTDRFAWTPNTDVQGIQFIFMNASNREAGVVYPTGNAVKVVLAVEQDGYHLLYPRLGASSGQPISTGGKTGSWIGDGEIAVSDPCFSSQLARGSTQYYRLHKSVAPGGKWPLTQDNSNHFWSGVGTTDAVFGAATTDGSDATAAHKPISTMQPFRTDQPVSGWAALAVIAEQITPVPVWMITGDSIGYGYANDQGRGYIGQAFEALGVAFHNDALPGGDLFAVTKWWPQPAMLADYVDGVIAHCQTNAIFGSSAFELADYKNSLLNFAKIMLRGESRLVLTTVFPRNASTDVWATYANQSVDMTVNSGGQTPRETVRVQANNFLRDPGPNGAVAWLNANLVIGSCAGVIDAAAAVERNADGSPLVLDANGQQTIGTGGRWIVNGQAQYATSDGIHPQNNVVPMLAATVRAQPALFALPAGV